MKVLLEKRPEMIKEGDRLGWTPLHYAAHYGDLQAIQLFLHYDPSSAYLLDNDGSSAVHVAAFHGRIDVIEELLSRCPDARDLVDARGRTLLHAAVLGARENVVWYVLKKQRLVGLLNEADNERNTPLHLAVLHRKYSIVAILARDGRVDIYATNKELLRANGIHSRRKETGLTAWKIFYMVGTAQGVQYAQEWVDKIVRRRLRGELLQEDHETETAMNESVVEIHLLAATLIATVTFAAAFTLPGGYKNDVGPDHGMATLIHRAAFRAFVIFDVIAFSFAAATVYLLFYASMGGYHRRPAFVLMGVRFIFMAIVGLVLAFASGLYVVLAQSTGLAIGAYVMAGCFILCFFVYWFCDPRGHYVPGLTRARSHVRNLLFRYGII